MDPDRDLAAALPDAPPPRPDRREASIAAALRRFDGGERSPAPAQRPPVPRWFGRPQLVALTAALLVVAIGLPVALTENPWSGASEPQAPARIAPPATAPVIQEDAAVPPPPAAPTREASLVDPAPPLARNRSADEGAVEPAAPQPSPKFAAPAPPPPSPALSGAVASSNLNRLPQSFAADREEHSEVVVTGSRIRRSDYAAASPIVTVDSKVSAKTDTGDWNACTIDDPEQNLRRCGRFADAAAPGAAGRAAAHLADGLARAWSGDLDGAIAGFDRAIDQSPRMAIAWLNRGLTWQRKGDIKRALTDLDKAVRYAPRSARAYYYRSLLFHQRGDARRAEADEQRAVELDARYGAVVGGE